MMTSSTVKSVLILLVLLLRNISITHAQLDTSRCTGALGDVKYSILDPDDFIEVNGDCWILMDGRDVRSSKLGAMGIQEVPDGMGYFVRGHETRKEKRIDRDRAFDSPIGSIQKVQTQLKVHSHFYQDIYFMEHKNRIEDRGGRLGGTSFFNTDLNTRIGSGETDYDNTPIQIKRTTEKAGPSDADTETRPVNINLWMYIRIN